jgi:hypothetical protein
VGYREVGRRSALEEPEQFEHNHDNDNYSDYVEDTSVHARDSYQTEAVTASIFHWMDNGFPFCFPVNVDSRIGVRRGEEASGEMSSASFRLV